MFQVEPLVRPNDFVLHKWPSSLVAAWAHFSQRQCSAAVLCQAELRWTKSSSYRQPCSASSPLRFAIFVESALYRLRWRSLGLGCTCRKAATTRVQTASSFRRARRCAFQSLTRRGHHGARNHSYCVYLGVTGPPCNFKIMFCL